MHPGVAVAIRDIQVARGRPGDIGGSMKGPGGLLYRIPIIPRPAGLRRLIPGAQGHQEVACRTVLQHHVRVHDRQVEVLLLIDEHPVGGRQNAFSPRGEEDAIAVEDNQGMLTPVEQIDPVARIRDDASLAQGPAFREFYPVFHQLIGVLARTYRCHLSFPPYGSNQSTAALSPITYCHLVRRLALATNMRTNNELHLQFPSQFTHSTTSPLLCGRIPLTHRQSCDPLPPVPTLALDRG